MDSFPIVWEGEGDLGNSSNFNKEDNFDYDLSVPLKLKADK